MFGNTNALRPLLFWLVLLVFSGAEFRLNHWELLLIMFAALELTPRALRILQLPQPAWFELLPAIFSVAFLFEHFWYLAIPYAVWATWLALRETAGLLVPKERGLAELVRVFALGYWATGAVFAVLYLANLYPLDFDPVIVALTAAHFHVAGFVLSTVVFALNRLDSGRINRLLAIGSLFGMPLVAAGITLSKLGYPGILEQVSALIFVIFASGVLIQQIRNGFSVKFLPVIRGLWVLGAVCLIAGLLLAGLYAIRFQYPLSWIHIPNMKWWHGTLNTFGFAWLSLIGYELLRPTTQNFPAT